MKSKIILPSLIGLIFTMLCSSCTGGVQINNVPNEPNVVSPVFHDMVESLNVVSWLTGPHATTNTLTEWGIGGTDLGIPFYDSEENKMYFAFGDTYLGYAGDGDIRSGVWRSNVIGVTTDYNAKNGLTFDYFLNDDGEMAKQIIGRIQSDNVEVTNIPTGGIFINGTMYLFHMSVRHWGNSGDWEINYAGCFKSEDKGETWSKVRNLIWTESDSTVVQYVSGLSKERCRNSLSDNFLQIFPVDGKDGYIYLYGIPGGRTGGVKLMRVTPENFEVYEEYEYYLGNDSGNNPIFEKGSEARLALHNSDVGYIIPPQFGEISVMYNPYLQKWVAMSQVGNKDLYIRLADKPWGEFSEAILIARQTDYPVLYCGFIHEKYTEENGKVMYFFMSRWDEYNVEVMRLEFK